MLRSHPTEAAPLADDQHGAVEQSGFELVRVRHNSEHRIERIRDAAVLRHNLGYFAVGRYSGFAPYFFPGVVSLAMFLAAATRRPLWQWLIAGAAVVSAVGLLVYMPYTYSGGGGPVGNRYYMSFYPLFLFVTPDYYATFPKACMDGWGRRFVLVSPDGLALPCHAAHTLPGSSFDNVRDRSLGEIWRESEGFRRFRGEDWMREPCRSCERRAVDYGGCRCQAFHLTGDPTATDPVCSLSPDHALVEAARAAADAGEAIAYEYRTMRTGADAQR